MPTSLTRAELERHFPGRPESFYVRNAIDCAQDGAGGKTRDPRPAPVVERNSRDGAVGALPVQKTTGGNFLVRVTAFRCRLLDEDNLCEKYHVDLCRYAGILPSDAAGKAKIETGQEKVGSEAEERVEIAIIRILTDEQLLLDASMGGK